jgi:hypothetical protein
MSKEVKQFEKGQKVSYPLRHDKTASLTVDRLTELSDGTIKAVLVGAPKKNAKGVFRVMITFEELNERKELMKIKRAEIAAEKKAQSESKED